MNEYMYCWYGRDDDEEWETEIEPDRVYGKPRKRRPLKDDAVRDTEDDFCEEDYRGDY